jgi:hypothetical protein
MSQSQRVTASPALSALASHLRTVAAGTIEPDDRLLRLLADAWADLDGGWWQGMTGSKVFLQLTEGRIKARIESVTWAAPVLAFVIERHGRTVNGSKFADLHRWTIDLDAGSASCEEAGRRQLYKFAKGFDATEAAAEVAEAVACGGQEPWLKWQTPGEAVRVIVGNIPELRKNAACRQTVNGRRRRFAAAIHKAMTAAGWTPGRASYAYTKRGQATNRAA